MRDARSSVNGSWTKGGIDESGDCILHVISMLSLFLFLSHGVLIECVESASLAGGPVARTLARFTNSLASVLKSDLILTQFSNDTSLASAVDVYSKE